MRIVGRADRTYIVGRQLRFLASLHVDGLRHCFKMLDVHAGWVAAEMIDYQAVRYGSTDHLPRYAMGELSVPEGAVPLAVPAAMPDMAIRIDIKMPAISEQSRLKTSAVSHDEPTCVIAFDIRRLAATAFAQLRSRIFVHAASLIEVVNGSAGLTACAPSILVRNAA